jgi:hypothetical protein
VKGRIVVGSYRLLVQADFLDDVIVHVTSPPVSLAQVQRAAQHSKLPLCEVSRCCRRVLQAEREY